MYVWENKPANQPWYFHHVNLKQIIIVHPVVNKNEYTCMYGFSDCKSNVFPVYVLLGLHVHVHVHVHVKKQTDVHVHVHVKKQTDVHVQWCNHLYFWCLPPPIMVHGYHFMNRGLYHMQRAAIYSTKKLLIRKICLANYYGYQPNKGIINMKVLKGTCSKQLIWERISSWK